jgi:uncharacterized protein (DUF302 family)
MQGNGLVQVASPYPVDETVKRLQSVLAQKGCRCLRWWIIAARRRKLG